MFKIYDEFTSDVVKVKLVEDDDGINLVTMENGEVDEYILYLTQDGKIILCSGVGDKFQTDINDYVKTEREEDD